MALPVGLTVSANNRLYRGGHRGVRSNSRAFERGFLALGNSLGSGFRQALCSDASVEGCFSVELTTQQTKTRRHCS